jgi:hypothetical protein
MPVRTQWLVEDRVILGQFMGDISESDMVSFLNAVKNMLSTSSDKPVHLLQDVTRIGKPYTNLKQAGDMLGFMRQLSGWYVVLSEPGNRLFEMLASISAQLVGIRTRPPFNTYEELRAFLLEHDSDLALPNELPWLFNGDVSLL